MNLAAKANKKEKKTIARMLALTAILLLVVLPVACGFVGSRAAHGQETDVDVEQLILTSSIMTGVPDLGIVGLEGGESAEPDKPWTVEMYYATRSAFKAFGSVASDDPIAGLSVSYSDDSWDILVLGVEEIGTHESGVIAGFGDLIIQKKFTLGDWDGLVGTEVFYGPPYRGGQSSTFIGPMGSLSRDLSDRWSFEAGGQYVGTYHTAYGDGDRLYFYGEFSYEYENGPWGLGSSVGVIASDKERYSVYVRPKVFYRTSWVKLQVSLLRSESDSQTGRFAIPATPTVSAIWMF